MASTFDKQIRTHRALLLIPYGYYSTPGEPWNVDYTLYIPKMMATPVYQRHLRLITIGKPEELRDVANELWSTAFGLCVILLTNFIEKAVTDLFKSIYGLKGELFWEARVMEIANKFKVRRSFKIDAPLEAVKQLEMRVGVYVKNKYGRAQIFSAVLMKNGVASSIVRHKIEAKPPWEFYELLKQVLDARTQNAEITLDQLNSYIQSALTDFKAAWEPMRVYSSIVDL